MVNNSVEAMIQNIVTVVLRIHFYYVSDPDLQNDLKQEGYLKAYELLARGDYDPNKNLRTYIYTGVRNAMTNYMYHSNKETHEDLELVSSPMWQRYESVTQDGFYEGKLFHRDEIDSEDLKIDREILSRVVERYNMFGDYTQVILRELKRLGLYEGDIAEVSINEIPLVTTAILGEIFYTIFMG